MNGPGGFEFQGDVHGQDLNFAGRDLYYTQILRERNSLLHEIAATRTRASTLVVVGFLMVAGGAIAFALPILSSADDFGSMNPTDLSFPGPRVGGISVGLIGFAVAFIGQFLLIAGIVLHIVAAARRRRMGELPPIPGAPPHSRNR